jgi:hypothetical protein
MANFIIRHLLDGVLKMQPIFIVPCHHGAFIQQTSVRVGGSCKAAKLREGVGIVGGLRFGVCVMFRVASLVSCDATGLDEALQVGSEC